VIERRAHLDPHALESVHRTGALRGRPDNRVIDHKKKLEQLGAKLDPALKDWIDNVIVPGLVKQYVKQKSLTLNARVVPHSPAHETSAEAS
jgi:hypothetical protein